MKLAITALVVCGLPVAMLGADAKAGAAVYDKSCKSCHGADGTPNAGIAKMMKVEMKNLKDPAVQKLTADAIKKVVTEGQGKMKPVKTVAGGDLDNVIAYVKSMK